MYMQTNALIPSFGTYVSNFIHLASNPYRLYEYTICRHNIRKSRKILDKKLWVLYSKTL